MSEMKSSLTVIDVVVAVVHRGGQILIAQRNDDAKHLAGYWEFPGGKREPGESIDDCLARELLEELDLRATPVMELSVIEYAYPSARVRLIPKLCEFAGGDPKPIACQQFLWIDPARLRDYSFPPANELLINEVLQHFERPSTM